MNDNQLKVILDSLVEASKMGTANALTYIQKGLEAFKNVKIPILNRDGEAYAVKEPYRQEGVREFVDFMIIYLDEAIKSIDNKDKSE